MNVVETQLLTAEQFAALPDDGRFLELVKGRIVEMNMPGARHGRVCLRIGQLLQNFLDENDLGRAVGNDTGVVTERNPDTVRGADVSYYSYARLPKDQPLPAGYVGSAPDVVFEVLSPSDTWSRTLAKVAEYLNAGVAVVCVVDPDRELAVKYYPDRPQERISANEALTFPELLPGFSLPLARLFT